MKTKSKSNIIWKILAAVAAFIIIGFVLLIYNAFNGNFISGMYYRYKVDRYIAETYPEKNYRVSDYSYDFKIGNYMFRITDPDSPDGCFDAYYSDYEGKVIDTYENDVVNLNNTLMRLEKELRNEVDPLIDKRFENDGDGTQEFGFATCVFGDYPADYYQGKLYPDMQANVKNLPIPTQVVLCFKTDEAGSFRRARELAEELKTLGYRIDYYEISTSGKPYEMIPADRLLSAGSVDELEEYVMKDYDQPKDKFLIK